MLADCDEAKSFHVHVFAFVFNTVNSGKKTARKAM